MGYWKKTSFLYGAASYLAFSLCIILFSSPLFRILGFEYSGFTALFVSLHVLYCSALRSIEERDRGVWKILKDQWKPVLTFSSIPLAVSLFSAIFIPNCSLWDGIVFYCEIVFPTSLIAMLSGVFFGSLHYSKRRIVIYATLFWIATFLLSLLPGYFSAKIYSYGWQYGYFPGLVWDEAMELRSEYWISRIVEMLVITSCIIYRLKIAKGKYYLRKIFSSWQYWFLVVGSTAYGIFYFFQFSDYQLHYYLRNILQSGNITIHFVSKNFSKDEEKLYSAEVKRYADEIDSIYGLQPSRKIEVFVLPTSDDLFRFVGTREASITKPWQRAVYITKGNFHSLKHELAHAILSGYGSFPFAMSWATGLTEGAAVAIEDDYDGIHSADDLSAQIFQMDLSSGVKNVMQFSGFLNSAPSTSYVLSGSFAEYLIRQYGADKFLIVYHDRDFDAVYSRSLPDLESEWKHHLKEIERPLDHYDSLRTLYYFKRTSILRQPCIRRIGKLLKYADEVFKARDYRLANRLYSIVVTESGRLKAIRGRVFCKLLLNDPKGALAILDTTPSAKESQNLPALRLLRGDVIAMASGDLAAASDQWSEAMNLQLGDSYFEAAFLRRHFFGNSNNVQGVQKILRDLYGLEETGDKYHLIFSIEPSDYAGYLGRLFLYVAYFERKGQLSDAYHIWKKGIDDIASLRPLSPDREVILFENLMKKKYSQYEKIFSLH
ncbi:MAG: hypothetical protein ACHQM6_05425 [Candidatus Kapaibacterium sp.]